MPYRGVFIMSPAQKDGIDLEELLEKAKRVSQEAEVFYVHHRDEPVLFEANRVKLVESRESSGVSLRVIKDGKVGFSSTSDFRDTDSLVNNTMEMVPFGPEARLEFPTYSSFSPVEIYDPRTESFPMDQMVNLGQTAIDRLVGSNSDLVCDASVSKGVTTITVLNSRGGYATYTKSIFALGVSGTLIKDTDMLFVSDGKSSCRPITDTSEIVATVEKQLEYSRNIVSAPVGQVPVIFTPKGVRGALLGPLMGGFSGKTVLQGASPLVGKLGEKMLDRRFSLWDEPYLPYVPGSRMCDDEGVPSRRMPLIDKGVISNFLYDLQTAAQAGEESTGNAHRGISSLPSPGTSVIVIGEGDVSYQDMIGGVKDGLIVESLLGAGQSNILGGDFNANVLLGYRVEGGSVTGRVKNTVISGNVYTALKDIQATEREGHWVGGSLWTPAFCLGSVSVATKE
jgi:PmbA protein